MRSCLALWKIYVREERFWVRVLVRARGRGGGVGGGASEWTADPCTCSCLCLLRRAECLSEHGCHTVWRFRCVLVWLLKSQSVCSVLSQNTITQPVRVWREMWVSVEFSHSIRSHWCFCLSFQMGLSVSVEHFSNYRCKSRFPLFANFFLKALFSLLLLIIYKQGAKNLGKFSSF